MIEIESVPVMRLEEAVLFYRSSDGVVATRHKVEDGKVQPGSPIDLNEAKTLFENGAVENGAKAVNQDCTWYQANVIARLSGRLVWWTPAQEKELFIAGKPEWCWLPPLIWCGSTNRRSLYLWVFDGKEVPTASTTVYRPSIGPVGTMNHIHQDSSVCLGDSVVKSFTPFGWTEAFYNSNFKTSNGLKGPYKIKSKFSKVGSLGDALSSLRQATD